VKKFESSISVRWSDVDANRHVRHSAYYDYGAHARIRFFTESGFDPMALGEMGIGPILFKEECSFIRELKPSDDITINLLKGDIRPDGSRWTLHHEIFSGRQKSAHITIKGAWMDLKLRKLAVPPPGLAKAIQTLPEGEDFIYKK